MGSKDEIIVIGDLVFDVKKKKDTEVINVGGGAYGSTIGAAKYSPRVGVVATVGEDFPLEKISRTGASLTGVRQVPGEKTARFTLEITENNERLVTASIGLITQAYVASFPAEYLGADHVHLSTSHPEKYLQWISYLRQCSPETMISVDAFEMYAREHARLTLDSFAQADMVFLNRDELELLGSDTVLSYQIPIILKYGAKGADYIHRDTRFHVEAPPVIAKDTTGAGDVLAGAFLGLCSQGLPVPKALEKAVKLASLSVTEVGLEHLEKSDVELSFPNIGEREK